MASKTQKTEAIRKRKHAANPINLKTVERRLKKNLDVLAKVTEKE